ncbi:hypothetical protein [Thalassotalea sp. ND16A]|uniref:hypothetical protein n=1 Tax=Thalassotalea sp. ND16A TaxID=1535422 RepID=UPI000519F75E|nr:hypothetical protein [Thalassotalea sp. ND16A]KGJ98097.1 hypothetical protein ND16A_0902 [Thalassotalea sp. ND16A]
MDEYSDLNFFAIVAKGHKQEFIDNLDWLTHIHDIAWCFKNTNDGYKLLWQCSQGMEKCAESAQAMLQFVKQRYIIDESLEHEIRQLIC